MLTVGQYATDIHTGKTIQIVGAQQVFGVTTYGTVKNLSQNG